MVWVCYYFVAMHEFREGQDLLYPESIYWFRYPCPDIPRRLEPGEKSIWRRLCELYPTRWWLVAFDVRVGQGETPPFLAPTAYREMIRLLSQGRIDVLVTNGDNLEMLELKSSAGFGSVGQLLCYKYLMGSTYPDLPVVRPILVSFKIKLDIVSCCSQFGIIAEEIWE